MDGKETNVKCYQSFVYTVDNKVIEFPRLLMLTVNVLTV